MVHRNTEQLSGPRGLPGAGRSRRPARLRTFLSRYGQGRNLFADRLFEDFLVSAAVSIVAVRLILELTGYPTLAPGGLHIAHMLWGGLGMLIAIVIVLSSLHPLGAPTAAVIGGIGFGVFIDELGKFVTSDNNYFFKPTFAIIYMIFIVLYLGVRGLKKNEHASDGTRLINILEIMKRGVAGPLSPADHQRARDLLAQCDPGHPLARTLGDLLREMEVAYTRPPGLLTRIRRAPARLYAHVRTNRWFAWGLVLFFIGHAVTRLVLDVISVREVGRWFFIWLVAALVILIVVSWDPTTFKRLAQGRSRAIVITLSLAGLAALWFAVRATDMPSFELAAWAEVMSSGLANFLVVIGLLRMRTSRLGALKTFRLALLILIFFTQFFAFYRSQLTAGIELAANLVVYGILRYMIDQEEGAGDSESSAEAETSAPPDLSTARETPASEGV